MFFFYQQQDKQKHMIALPCFEKKHTQFLWFPLQILLQTLHTINTKKFQKFQVVCFRPYCIRILQASNRR